MLDFPDSQSQEESKEIKEGNPVGVKEEACVTEKMDSILRTVPEA